MKEINTECGVKKCTFSKDGRCGFLLEAVKTANEFQGAVDSSPVEQNNAIKRWGIIVNDIHTRLAKSDCVRKNDVGIEMQKIVPESLESNLKDKITF